MYQPKYLAFDFGAESGRAIIGELKDDKLTLKEKHRFPNGMVNIHGSFHWNIFRLYEEMKKSLKILALDKITPASMAIDTWGVDFGLFDENGKIIGIPYTYRDPRTDNAMEQFFEKMPPKEIYRLTGIQFAQYNTLFQLQAMVEANSPALKIAKNLLFIPDIFNYFFSGEMKTEFSFATTSQLFNPLKFKWEEKLFEKLNLPINLMQEVVKPGTITGKLTKKLAGELAMPQIPVTAVTSHDTGSAIVAIPAEGENWAYISSGTWSLMGIEVNEPIITEQSQKFNFTNEGGAEKTYRFLKNIMGLWLLQECKRNWALEGTTYSYSELVVMARKAKPFAGFINPDDKTFLNPQNMPKAIYEFCKKTKQECTENHAQIARIILEGLALKYRYTVEQLKQVSPKPIEKIHIIGGGMQNQLLCQFTANATGMPVIAGPAEGTAAGNVMIQALAQKHIGSLAEIRKVIKNSFDIKQYLPQDTNQWNEAYKRFVELVD